MLKRVHVVVNPISGRRRSRAGARAFLQRVERDYSDVTITETRGSGDASVAAETACAVGADALIVVGGDGTAREAVCGVIASKNTGGLHGTAVPILIVPCGTENVVAKYLGLRIDCELLLNVLAGGKRIGFDIGRCNGRSFLFVCGVGYDAAVVQALAAKRKGHISYFTYVGPLLKTLMHYKAPTLRVEVDGKRVFEGAGQLVAGSISRYAFGMKILGRAIHDDGLLDVCVFEYSGRMQLLWHAIRVIANRHLGSHGVYYWQGKRLRVETDGAAPVELDGDGAGVTPIDIAMESHRVEFLVPG